MSNAKKRAAPTASGLQRLAIINKPRPLPPSPPSPTPLPFFLLLRLSSPLFSRDHHPIPFICSKVLGLTLVYLRDSILTCKFDIKAVWRTWTPCDSSTFPLAVLLAVPGHHGKYLTSSAQTIHLFGNLIGVQTQLDRTCTRDSFPISSAPSFRLVLAEKGPFCLYHQVIILLKMCFPCFLGARSLLG